MKHYHENKPNTGYSTVCIYSDITWHPFKAITRGNQGAVSEVQFVIDRFSSIPVVKRDVNLVKI